MVVVTEMSVILSAVLGLLLNSVAVSAILPDCNCIGFGNFPLENGIADYIKYHEQCMSFGDMVQPGILHKLFRHIFT